MNLFKMESIEVTPTNRKYPLRKTNKIKYYHDEDYDSSPLEKKPKKKSKVDLSDVSNDNYDVKENQVEDSSFDGDEKENTVETENENLPEYERIRLKNIEDNRRVMMELGLIDPLKTKEEKKVKAKPRVVKRAHKPQSKPEPMKRSLRLLRRTPEGKDISFDLFAESPTDSPTVKEEKTRIEEEVLSMSENGESTDFLDSLKSSLSQSSSKLSLSQDSAVASLASVDSLIDEMRGLKFADAERVNRTRTQSLLVHPMESSLLVIGGSKTGELGLWNATDGSVARFQPHLRALNCISVSDSDYSKIFTTSHDGTVRKADLHKSVFDLAYQTGEKTDFCHITWHTQLDAETLMVAHGTGEIGVIDLRTKTPQRWFHCHPRSVRTIHLHPRQPHYFVTCSGTGEAKIWDLRGSKKHVDGEECVGDLSINTNKGFTSTFFSPDGTRIVGTSNDDYIRIYDSSDLTKPKVTSRILHDNHTGRWLSVFKASFHPQSSDLILVGSMLKPRRIQMYSGSGILVKELKDGDNLTTVVPVIAVHPTQPIIVGGNSSGKVHVFTTDKCRVKYVRERDESDAEEDSDEKNE